MPTVGAPASAPASAPAPSSAAVLEFICLFTKDLRRKQKRWEDGRLKFHTFNNRVMVYDERGSFVGDMHWRRDYNFGEGEDIELERGGTLVQVQDLVHRTEQDLSELIDKRVKEKEQRQLQAVARARGPTSVLPQTMPQSTPRPAPADHFQLRHRSLHQLIGTPSGHHGRAVVPPESPYESRQQDADSPDDRAAKRRKYEAERPTKKGHAQALFGQTLTLSATPMSSMLASRPPRKVQSSSASADKDQRDAGQYGENALREQSKSSLSFNQKRAEMAGKSRPTTINSRNGISESTKDGRDNLAPDRRLKRTTMPANAEVIDIDDLGSLAVSDPPIPRPESMRRRPGKRPVKAIAQPKSSLSKKLSGQKVLPSNLSASVARQKCPMSGIEDGCQPVEASSTNVRTAAIEPSHDKDEMHVPDETSMKKDRPMIELRLRSKKKRGLLMMSDRLTPLRSSEPSSAAAKTFEAVDEVVAAEHPRPRTNPRQRNKVYEVSDHSTVLEISLELGEEDDPFRSPSPQPLEQHCATESQSGLRNNENGEKTVFSEVEIDTDANLEADSVTMVEESLSHDNDVLGKGNAQRLATQGLKDDPYRLPSSSPEIQSPVANAELPNSPNGADLSPQGNSFPVDVDVIGEGSGLSEAENTVRLKRNGRARRNIFLDEDEESETLFEDKKDAGSVEEETVALDPNSEDVPPKQVDVPTTAARRRKRNPVAQKEDEQEDENEDEEQPRKRRTSTRKARHRRPASEFLSESNEEQESEQERPARSRRNKAHTISEERPRLTRVKKSVNSRELIGFDLSALNAPLGPRGIGIPFSILSSPAEESSRDTVAQNTAVSQLSSNAGLDVDEQQIQLDAPKASAMSTKEMPKVFAPVPTPENVDEEQPDPKLLTGKAVAVSGLLDPDLQRPRLVTQLKTSPCQGQNQDVGKGTAEAQNCEVPIATHQLQDTRITDRLCDKCPEEHSPLLNVSVDESLQGGASDLAEESSSSTHVSDLPVSKSLKEKPPSLSLQCEPRKPESRTKDDEEQTTSPIVKAAAWDPTMLSHGGSEISDSTATYVSASTARESGRPEVEQAAAATARPPQPRRTVGLRRTASAVRSINNIQMEVPPVEATKSPKIAEDTAKPIARIANPATRGRKAALRSHAAGQAPQRILPPTQLPLLVPISTADLALTPIEEPKREPERPKRKMQFPGFQSARGEGPWSREAFDLLETGRPG